MREAVAIATGDDDDDGELETAANAAVDLVQAGPPRTTLAAEPTEPLVTATNFQTSSHKSSALVAGKTGHVLVRTPPHPAAREP